MISFENISFSYDDREFILDNVTFQFQSGLTLLIGPNGCGKSTLLKLAAGVEKPDSGNITINGHDLWTHEVAARQSLAYLPEHPDLTPYAAIRDILKLVWRLRGRPDRGISPALEFFDLESSANRSVRKLSKGQRRRAVFAAILIGNPECLLLDEPLEGMDQAVQDKILSWIDLSLKKGKTIVAVSHMYTPFLSMVSHVVTINKGKTSHIQNLPPDESKKQKILDTLARGALNYPLD